MLKNQEKKRQKFETTGRKPSKMLKNTGKTVKNIEKKHKRKNPQKMSQNLEKPIKNIGNREKMLKNQEKTSKI